MYWSDTNGFPYVRTGEFDWVFVPGYVVDGYTVGSVYYNISRQDCRAHCEAEPRCVSCEIELPASDCYMNEDSPESPEISSSYDLYFIRDLRRTTQGKSWI